ncbi:MAG: efflux RND transporter periplasmic adaptor subunit [Solidesulfovibrio sp.]
MKRTYTLITGLLAALALCLAGQAHAETVTFVGKSYCPIKTQINWPFSLKTLPGGAAMNKSATAMGSDMSYLRILSASATVGQHVTEDQAVLTYEMPLEKILSEKKALSHSQIDELEAGLSKVDYKLAALRSYQEDLEKQVTIQSIAPNDVNLNLKEIETLHLQRDSFIEKLEQAKSGYDTVVRNAKKTYGDDLNVRNLPRKGFARSPIDGYVLWVNSSLVPGMVFTKPVALLTVGSLDPIVVRAAVHEIAVQKLKVGDQVSVTFRALPDQPMNTTITKINAVAQPATSQQPSYYEIELTVPNADLRIKEGMRCDITINLP